MQELVNRIDTLVNQHHLLKHPFYVAWSEGALSLPALQDYAVQYYKHVLAFPTYLSAVHARTDDEELRHELLKNLMDEEGYSPTHPQLWLQFASGLGLEPEVVKKAGTWPETRQLIDSFRSICAHSSIGAAVACLYAYESQIPAVCEVKIDGLRKFYGIEDPKTYEYFTVHIQADIAHADSERRLLKGLLNEQEMDAVEKDVRRVLQGLWQLLSGVGRRHGVRGCEQVEQLA